jgi:hypothetical protein
MIMETPTSHVLAESTAAHSNTYYFGRTRGSREECNDLQPQSPTIVEVVVELIHDLANFSEHPTCVMSSLWYRDK